MWLSPPVLIADLNRKVLFKCSTIEDDIRDDIDNADYVDCEEFWSKEDHFGIKPSTANWSPYMGSNTRFSNIMVNTEHRKVHKDSGEVEPDCRELCQEPLIEHMHEEKTCEITKIARKIGVTDKGSKLDSINRVKAALQKINTKFNKSF